MSNSNYEGLPPEMQQRIANIIANAKGTEVNTPHQAAIQPAQSQAPVAPQPQPQVAPVPAPPKPPNLMDHVILLRQEVAAMRQELHAVAQVTDAVGQAVGQMYAMFQSQTEPSNYSSNFQTEVPQQHLDEDY